MRRGGFECQNLNIPPGRISRGALSTRSTQMCRKGRPVTRPAVRTARRRRTSRRRIGPSVSHGQGCKRAPRAGRLVDSLA